jgi:Domain of unknown function (DUF4274)
MIMPDESVQDRMRQRLLEWLPTQSPAVWHEVAVGWNWDNGIEPLDWIIRQKGCDAGTAQHIFWLGNVDSFEERTGGRSDVPHYRLDLYDMLLTIIGRWRAGEYLSWQYTTSSPYMVPAKEKISSLNADFVIPDSLTEVHKKGDAGVEIEMDEGFPLEIVRKCYEDLNLEVPDWSKPRLEPSEIEKIRVKLKDHQTTQKQYLQLCHALFLMEDVKLWRKEIDFASMTRDFANIRRKLNVKASFKPSEDQDLYERMVLMTEEIKERYLNRMKREFNIQDYPEHPDYIKPSFFSNFFKK